MLASHRILPCAAGTHSRPQRCSLLVSAAIKAKSARQICCSKTLVAKPEHKEQVQKLCQQAVEFSQQQMASRSNGIQEFSCAVDGWEDNVFHFWERYDSNTTMGKHNTKPEMEQFMKQVVELLERPVGMALYEYRDGKIGGVAIQSGPKGEGGLDDATGASGAAGGASYKQTSKAVQLTFVEEEDDSRPTQQQQQQQQVADAADAWWSWAGSQPAAVAALAGAAAVCVFAALRLTGH